MAKDREQKGSFGDVKLPVSRKYVVPTTRRLMLLIGIAIAAVSLAAAFLDLRLGKGRLLSNGPLVSSHAAFEKKCDACHEPASGRVTDRMCNACHELNKADNALPTYGHRAHYIYRSEDPAREQPKAGRVAHALACIDCHMDHRGRDANIKDVPDATCAACHKNDAFATGHREFEFARDGGRVPDAATLRFTHGRHTCKVMARGPFANVENACLFCHNPQPDGRGFAPIQYDRHCDESGCHLTTTEVAQAARPGPGRVGVELPQEIAARHEPGSAWTAFVDPAEYKVKGDFVEKRPVYHADPWVLANLRTLRKSVYPDGGLADLLIASGDPAIEGKRALYREAIATLEGYALELRARPQDAVRDDLEKIRASLRDLRAALADPRARLDASLFALKARPQDAAATQVGNDLTKVCTRQCHVVSGLTIARVQKDQRVLTRAEFDHRAHVVDRRCLDCHKDIDVLAVAGPECKPDKEKDRVEVQNLPMIATCRECHAPGLTSDRCVACHLFHPDKTRRAQLTLTKE